MDANISKPTYTVYRPGDRFPDGSIAPSESRAPGALVDRGGTTYQWTGATWTPLRPTTSVPSGSQFPTQVYQPVTPAGTPTSYPEYSKYITPMETLVTQATSNPQLKAFYENVLNFAKGDLDLAKRIINYTYDSGIRESRSDYELEQRRQQLDFPQEVSRLKTEQNRRGILESGFGGQERGRLLESQAIRREAVDRALKQREENLLKTKEFGTEKEQLGFAKQEQDVSRQKEQDIFRLAERQAGLEQQKYGAEVGKFQFGEQQKIAQEQLALQKKAVG